jgi:hypothetical protein
MGPPNGRGGALAGTNATPKNAASQSSIATVPIPPIGTSPAVDRLGRRRPAPRGPTALKERDLARVLRAVNRSGTGVSRVQVSRDGDIVLILGKDAKDANSLNSLDQWMADRHADKA